jgi:hypothetical protein
MLQLLVVNSPSGRGKQICHSHSHTTLSDIACIVDQNQSSSSVASARTHCDPRSFTSEVRPFCRAGMSILAQNNERSAVKLESSRKTIS